MSKFVKYLIFSAEYSEKGNYKKAIECWEKIIELKPNQPTVWVMMGLEYKKLSQWEKAIECFDKALQLNPSDKDAQKYKKLGKKNEIEKLKIDKYPDLQSPDILYTKIAFPLLKCLLNAGDPMAKEVYKNELLRPFKNRNFHAIIFIVTEGFTTVLNKEELTEFLSLFASKTPPSKNGSDSKKDRQLLSLWALHSGLKSLRTKQTEESQRVVEVIEDILRIEYNFDIL